MSLPPASGASGGGSTGPKGRGRGEYRPEGPGEGGWVVEMRDMCCSAVS